MATAKAIRNVHVDLKEPTSPTAWIEKPTDLVYQETVTSIQEKYARERAKRLRADGNAQFVHVKNSNKLRHLDRDLWLGRNPGPRLELQDGMHTKVFIIGGGFGGLVNAVRLVQAGIRPEDMVIADSAGGFGGTWYWNRFPGLMSDIESYIYLPLLEETGYVPKHKYSYGEEIRQYMNLIARTWRLDNRGAFQQSVEALDWEDTTSCWRIRTHDLATNAVINLSADFVIVASGVLHKLKSPKIADTEQYKGHIFHTARWDYDYTGGSPEDQSLVNLKDKRVGIIGTGATAVQVIPHLARWAKELYVFQRTPSAIHRRGQRPTDLSEFSKYVADRKGWQLARNRNFNCFISNTQPLPSRDLVNDGVSHNRTISAIVGGPKAVSPNTAADHVASIHAIDLPRQQAVRDHVDRVVRDKQTAQKLKPWYPGFCKRPCYQDDYLPSFNLPNVRLVDTDGKGIDRLSADGIVANSSEYPLDCIVLSTGFALEGPLCPTRKADITTRGRHGLSLDDKWRTSPGTLHGVLTRDFPNLFFSGPTQAGGSPNFTLGLDQLAQHTAHIISRSQSLTSNNNNDDDDARVTIEPTRDAEEEWSSLIASGAPTFAGVRGCTPSFFNGEGDAFKVPAEKHATVARLGLWSRGMNDFIDVLARWRDEGSMRGLEITVV